MSHSGLTHVPTNHMRSFQWRHVETAWYPRANITKAFLSTEEVTEALDKDGPAMESEMDSLSLHSFVDEPHAASTASELPSQELDEQIHTANEDLDQEEAEQAYLTSEEPSQEEDERPHTASEVPGHVGETSVREGPSGGGMYTLSEESSQGESSQDVDSNDEEAPKKKATRKRERRPDVWQKNKRKRRRNLGRKYVSTSKNVVSGIATRYLALPCTLAIL